jgi:alkylated DNA nucleotide flippase Atl1
MHKKVLCYSIRNVGSSAQQQAAGDVMKQVVESSRGGWWNVVDPFI